MKDKLQGLQEEEIKRDKWGNVFPPKRLCREDIEWQLGLDYDPTAPDSTLAPTEFINAPIRMKMTAEDVLEQRLHENPNIKVIIPNHIRRFGDCYLTVAEMHHIEGDTRLTVRMEWNTSTGKGHMIEKLTVRMNPKARLHIIVK